jgi:hypothetical protein
MMLLLLVVVTLAAVHVGDDEDEKAYLETHVV